MIAKEVLELVKLKKRMENNIGDILESFEKKTGLQVDTIFLERTEIQSDDKGTVRNLYDVNVPVHL